MNVPSKSNLCFPGDVKVEDEEVFPDVERNAEDKEEVVGKGEEGDGDEEEEPKPEEHKDLLRHNVGSKDAQEMLLLKSEKYYFFRQLLWSTKTLSIMVSVLAVLISHWKNIPEAT